MSQVKVHFPLSQLNSKISNLHSNGFEDYLNTWEKFTVHDEQNLNHIILTCKKGDYSGAVADIYYNEQDKRCWIEYSNQFQSN